MPTKNEHKTKTKQKIGLDFEIHSDKGSLSKINKKQEKTSFKPELRKDKAKFDFSDTNPEILKKMADLSFGIDQKLKDLGIEKEEDLDQEINQLIRNAGIEPKTKENLPAKIENLPKILSNELEEIGSSMVVPKWTMVKDLPGYMKGAIRAFGREVMKVLAPGTPLEKIYVISTIGKLNSERELNAVANFLKNHGIEDKTKSGKIIELLPDYNPLVKVYKALGYNWLVVQDFAGKYIYVGEDPNPPLISK